MFMIKLYPQVDDIMLNFSKHGKKMKPRKRAGETRKLYLMFTAFNK